MLKARFVHLPSYTLNGTCKSVLCFGIGPKTVSIHYANYTVHQGSKIRWSGGKLEMLSCLIHKQLWKPNVFFYHVIQLPLRIFLPYI
uniref:Uncharacterized protein n=1 Tax=Arundo donax TaxID=35708 RepID=A0A0A9FQB4_ARUDO